MSNTLSGAPDLKDITHGGTGQSWLEYSKSLHPNYLRVWFDIAVVYAMIIAGIVVIASLHAPYNYIAVPFVALWLGFWLHPLFTFFHEAAHYNLAPSRRWNDRLSLVLFTPFSALDVRLFRKLHWKHHLHLGLLEDTEVSYRNPLTLQNMLSMLTGITVVKSLLRYLHTHHALKEKPSPQENKLPSEMRTMIQALLIFAFTQMVIVLSLWFFVSFAAGLAWVLGQILFSPFFNWLRQILEHRSFDASGKVDYSKVEHGPANRLFDTGFIGYFFGAAGFSRHLLHHWDPRISYSRFDDMESFLLATPLAGSIEANRSTYKKAFFALFK